LGKVVENAHCGLNTPLTEKHPLVFYRDTCLNDLVLTNYKSPLVQCHFLHPCVLLVFINISMLTHPTLKCQSQPKWWFGSKLNI